MERQLDEEQKMMLKVKDKIAEGRRQHSQSFMSSL